MNLCLGLHLVTPIHLLLCKSFFAVCVFTSLLSLLPPHLDRTLTPPPTTEIAARDHSRPTDRLHQTMPLSNPLFIFIRPSLLIIRTLSTSLLHHSAAADRSASTEQSLIALFSSCSTMRDLTQIHARIILTGFDTHLYVAGRLISFCAVSPHGSIDHALALFRHLPRPDPFLYNTLIRGLARAHLPDAAFRLYARMRLLSIPPDNFTFNFLLNIAAFLASPHLARQLHAAVFTHGHHQHLFVRNTLIHAYAQCRYMLHARQLFDKMPHTDIVSWNTLIDGYVHCGDHPAALAAFNSMRCHGFRPDEATLVVTLSACAELGDVEFGRQLHSSIATNSLLEQNPAVSNSLIDMYAKCGDIDKALCVFEKMGGWRNVVSWNTIILGFAMHGRTEEAVKLFDRMREEEFEDPNDITFLGVLCACSHGGLVEEGKRYFNSMKRDYGITPSIKHYGCMVDLLGRAGLVREAYELVRSMPMEGNAVVWRTLLGACRVHGDIEMGELVRKHLGELEPDHSSNYVLLSHMYASAGRWSDVLQVREDMRGRGVQKPVPGNSLVETLPSVAYQ